MDRAYSMALALELLQRAGEQGHLRLLQRTPRCWVAHLDLPAPFGAPLLVLVEGQDIFDLAVHIGDRIRRAIAERDEYQRVEREMKS